MDQLWKTLLETVKNHLNLENVYQDPPRGLQMKIPCAVIELGIPTMQYADNIPYHWTNRWSITIIDRDGTKGEYYIRKMLELPYCSFDRSFKNDNLYHFTFTIYFKGGVNNE